MKTKIQHTPTPWLIAESIDGYKAIIEDKDGLIARVITHDSLKDEANAEFICRAVNSHGELLQNLKDVTRALKEHLNVQAENAKPSIKHVSQLCPCWKTEVANAGKAIAQAEGKL